MDDRKYRMSMSLNVLNHLGIKLYSNVPAVLSEAVANAWDADAEEVDININSEEIIITDDGHGMTIFDVNNRYLLVGYERRKDHQAITRKHHRHVMGRKGIGKLSLFAISDHIEIQSMKDGEKHGFIMSTKDIKKQIENGKETYFPTPMPDGKISIAQNGTQISLTGLKKRVGHASVALRKRLSRRFSIIGSVYKFKVTVNGDPIQVSDRDYFHKLQYLWYYGDDSHKYVTFCRESKLAHDEHRSDHIERISSRVTGWIGSVEKSGDLKDESENLNKIVVMVRGKLAQEDILEDFSEGGLYTKYLIGEINADFLDIDDEEDIATSSRQEIIKDDPRYQALKVWVGKELKHIQNSWTGLRNDGGTQEAIKIRAIKEWFNELPPDHKKSAKILFGKINQLTVESEDQRRLLFKHGVLAFESFKYKENLDALDRVSPENIAAITTIFAALDDIEATLYHQIVKGRIAVIKALHDKISDNALEKVIQEHLYEHLWLLEPHWERSTETPLMEQQVKTAFEKVDANLTEEELKGRFDIKYKNPSGKHVIIELKRAERAINSFDLGKQATKYLNALKKVLNATGKGHEPIEVICLVGRKCQDWVDEAAEDDSREMLEKRKVRVIMYQTLIEDAYSAYKTFIDKSVTAGRVSRLIEQIETENSDSNPTLITEPSSGESFTD